MSEFKTEGLLIILSLDEIELNIIPEEYGILDTEDICHVIEGEFFYCGLAIDGKLIVTENEMNNLLSLLNISIFKISEKTMYVRPIKISELKKLNLQVKFLSTENFDDDLEDDITIFKLI